MLIEFFLESSIMQLVFDSIAFSGALNRVVIIAARRFLTETFDGELLSRDMYIYISTCRSREN